MQASAIAPPLVLFLSLVLVTLSWATWAPAPPPQQPVRAPKGDAPQQRLTLASEPSLFTQIPIGAFLGGAVRGGTGWRFWEGAEEAATPTPMKREAAKEHTKKSWFWGKAWMKAKAHESEDKTKEELARARRQAARSADQSKESLEQARKKLGETYDSVKDHAKRVAHSAQEEVQHGLDATKGAARKATAPVQAAKHKVYQVNDAVEILSETKHAYDKVQAGKRKAADTVEAGAKKTKGFFRSVLEFFWPPARPECPGLVKKEEELLTPPCTVSRTAAEDIPTPRSVDEALEEFEACKNAERMTEEEAQETRSLFEAAKDLIRRRPILKKEQPAGSFKERWEREKAEAEERQRHW